tara:strand:+ start:503 stop:712 length:210 start_codon:yes stop_codon:yes gene_type:complete
MSRENRNFAENSYSYVYHLSSYRDDDTKWACINRENYVDYFNDPRSAKIGYGKTPELAFKNAKEIEKQK